jgi:hypothetical protein
MDSFGEKAVLGQNGHHRIDQLLQGLGRDGLDVGGDGIRTNGSTDFRGFRCLVAPLLEVPSRICLPLNPTRRIRGWLRRRTGWLCQKKARPATTRMR